jgi:hypothetical protein
MRALLLTVAVSVAGLTACTSPEPSASVAPSVPARTSASGSGVVVVPDLLGLDGSNAQHVISQLGLSSDLSVATGSYTHGGVVQQRPQAGSIVEPGATIHLVIGPTS